MTKSGFIIYQHLLVFMPIDEHVIIDWHITSYTKALSFDIKLRYVKWPCFCVWSDLMLDGHQLFWENLKLSYVQLKNIFLRKIVTSHAEGKQFYNKKWIKSYAVEWWGFMIFRWKIIFFLLKNYSLSRHVLATFGNGFSHG